MCLLFLFNFSKDFPFYIFFTTVYAESMFGAHRPTIENSGNKTEEEIDIIFKERLTDGTLEASKVFIAFPAGTMLFSLIFEKAKIFRRFGIKQGL
ncbi:Oidioi.mRNA.OKI2018_I69.chr2.g4224.t1.cds [Oikopleura dioica]|nr:Oidioi.mRNA.OKI2018_I69.chr2.g4224.t1.cds [Oikopleura dioica]